MKKLVPLFLAVLVVSITACEIPWIDLPPKELLPPVPEPVIAVPAEEPPEESIATVMPATVEPTAEVPKETLEPPVASDDFSSSSPFRREVRGDTALFYGKEGVVMEITPHLVRVEYGGYLRALEQDITIVVRDSAIGLGDEATIYVYAPSYRRPGHFTDFAYADPYSVHSPGIARKTHLGFFSCRTADYQRPIDGIDTQIYIAGYGRGRALYELSEEWEPGSGVTAEPFASSMAGTPQPEVLVEGYWEVEFYTPEPPRDAGLQEEGLVWGALTIVDGEGHYYLVDARERLDEEISPKRDYFIKVWKISKETGEVIAYGAQQELPYPYSSVTQISFTDGEEFRLLIIR